MPSATAAAVRKQIAQGDLAPIYLIVGDDDVEMGKLAAEISAVVEDELRAFNLERMYATDKTVTPASIAEAASTLPMLGDRRVVVVMRAGKILKPKRRGKSTDDSEGPADEAEPPSDLDVLERYVKDPSPRTTLVLVAEDVDRQRRLYKALAKTGTIVECWGLRAGKDDRVDVRQAARTAEQLVKQTVSDAGMQIDGPAARLVAERAGLDIAKLRADVDRLLLFAAGKPRITLADAREVVSAETAQDDWAVTNAIGRGDAREALRQLALALESGGVPYQILGQLAWFVREKMTAASPNRVPAAVDALFRTDLELKSSAGDPRVLLERLVVDLCRR